MHFYRPPAFFWHATGRQGQPALAGRLAQVQLIRWTRRITEDPQAPGESLRRRRLHRALGQNQCPQGIAHRVHKHRRPGRWRKRRWPVTLWRRCAIARGRWRLNRTAFPHRGLCGKHLADARPPALSWSGAWPTAHPDEVSWCPDQGGPDGPQIRRLQTNEVAWTYRTLLCQPGREPTTVLFAAAAWHQAGHVINKTLQLRRVSSRTHSPQWHTVYAVNCFVRGQLPTLLRAARVPHNFWSMPQCRCRHPEQAMACTLPGAPDVHHHTKTGGPTCAGLPLAGPSACAAPTKAWGQSRRPACQAAMPTRPAGSPRLAGPLRLSIPLRGVSARLLGSACLGRRTQ